LSWVLFNKEKRACLLKNDQTVSTGIHDSMYIYEITDQTKIVVAEISKIGYGMGEIDNYSC